MVIIFRCCSLILVRIHFQNDSWFFFSLFFSLFLGAGWHICNIFSQLYSSASCFYLLPIFFVIRWMPSPSIQSMAHWLRWAQMGASASGTKMLVPNWRHQSSLTNLLQLAASTTMGTSLHMHPVMIGQRYKIWTPKLLRLALRVWLTIAFHFEHFIPQGHEYYNPQKKNYIFLRNAAEELKPRNKKWWEKGSHRPLTWRPWSLDGAAPFPQLLCDSHWSLSSACMDVGSERVTAQPLQCIRAVWE